MDSITITLTPKPGAEFLDPDVVKAFLESTYRDREVELIEPEGGK